MAAASGGSSDLFAEGQVMTIFRSRRLDRAETAYRQLVQEMEAAARSSPGFVDFKTFTADDGERVSLVTFATPAAHQAWRDDPGHQQAQRLGREEFYLEYSVLVGACTHVSGWVRPG